MMGWYDGGMGWGGWMVMTLTMLLFWGLVVFAVVSIFRGTTRDDRGFRDHGPGDARSITRRDPRAILDERFANGEIDAEEYRARREVLDAAQR